MLGRKQRVRNQDFLDTLARIEEVVPRPVAMRVFTEAVREIRDYTAGKRVAFAWSGGKDSLALQAVCYEAGVRECLFTMTDLEYPVFLAWVTDNMPDRLEVVNTGQNLEWLARHLDWLFPQNATAAGRWFKAVQHTGQEFFYRKRDLDMLLLGRRRADGNYIGGKNAKAYESRGILRYCPLADWSHEQVMAVNHYLGLPQPPTYSWPNGFVVGTGAWPARQYTGSVANGWREVFAIDPTVVKHAATSIESARAFLRESE